MEGPDLPSDPVAPRTDVSCAQDRFAAELVKQSAAFDVAFAIAEGVWVVTAFTFMQMRMPYDDDDHFEPNKEMRAMEPQRGRSLKMVRIYPLLLPFVILVRICRARRSVKSSKKTEVLGTLFETVSLTLSSCYASSMLSPFMLITILSYMLIFVLPYRRGLIVIPVSFVTFLGVFDQPGTWGDIAALGVGLCLNLAAKRLIERSKWQAFQALDEKSKQALDEKILRYQAEFAIESATPPGHHHVGSDESTYLNGSCESDAGQASARRPAKPPMSLHSAPTILEASPGSHATVCLGADCLPPDVSVWVEGSSLPQPLQGLTTGARVLCFDRLGGSVKYVPASAVHTEAELLTWTDVRLDSGAILTMTADHPVQPVAPDPSSGACTELPVRAADLRPGVDSLLSLSTAPCLVHSVTSYEAEGARVSLAVAQPERHTIFVAARGAHAACGSLAYSQPLAVESADLATRPHGSDVKLVEKGTFLHCQDPAFAPKRLSVSAPPSLDRGGEEGGPSVKRQLPRSSDSTSDSGCTLSTGSAEVIVGQPSLEGNTEQPDARGLLPLRVSDVFRVWGRGLRSMGSLPHAGGGCKACVFENRRQFSGGGRCFKGVFCERCHEQHEGDIIQDKRQKRREQRGSQRKDKKKNLALDSRV